MEEALILQKIRELYKRYRLTTGWLIVTRFFIIGLALSALFLAFVKITGLLSHLVNLFFIPAVLFLAIGFIINFTRKIPMIDVALKTDKKMNLKERLTTVLEWVEENRLRSPMFRALLKDTAENVKELNSSSIFPLEWKKPLKNFALTILIITGLVLAPSLNLFASRIDPKEVKTIHKEAEKIAKKAEEIKKKKPKTPASLKKFKKVEKTLAKLSRELKEPNVTKRKALAKISKAQDDVYLEARMQKRLKKIEESLRKTAFSGSNSNKEVEEDEFEKMSKALRKMAGKLGKKKLSAEEKEKLLKTLEKLRDRMQKAGMKTEEIDKAIENLKKGSNDKARRSISRMANQFQKKSNEMADMNDLSEISEYLEDSKGLISGRQLKRFRGQRFSPNDGNKGGPGDYGLGSTNKQSEASGGKPGNMYAVRKDKKSLDKMGMYQKLYKPERTKHEAATGKVGGKISKGPAIKTLNSETRGAPRLGDVPVNEAGDRFVRYRTEGEEAVNRERIPSRYKDLIRNYYDEIDPVSGEKSKP